MKGNLEETALRLQGIIDAAIDGIITIDSKGIVETVDFAGSEPILVINGNKVKLSSVAKVGLAS